jgi:hypothetical protein
MAKKKSAKRTAEIRATAKVEAIAKATFQHKKTITEVVPVDVTRAKASRWLDLLSPITEWAGLRGDVLRYRRQQVRIQQESALDELADSVRRKLGAQAVLHPVPVKVLVPVLEAASLEDAESPLVEWWAELLVTAATAGPIRPFIVDLMGKIGVEEAKLLEELWDKFSDESEEAASSRRWYRALGYIHGNVRQSSGHLKNRVVNKSCVTDCSAPPKNGSRMPISMAWLWRLTYAWAVTCMRKARPLWLIGLWQSTYVAP